MLPSDSDGAAGDEGEFAAGGEGSAGAQQEAGGGQEFVLCGGREEVLQLWEDMEKEDKKWILNIEPEVSLLLLMLSSSNLAPITQEIIQQLGRLGLPDLETHIGKIESLLNNKCVGGSCVVLLGSCVRAVVPCGRELMTALRIAIVSGLDNKGVMPPVRCRAIHSLPSFRFVAAGDR